MPEAAFLLTRRLMRALRLKQNLTQEALAEKAGLDYKYYQNLELGKTDNPTMFTLGLIARALGVKLWVLVCDDPELITAHTGLTRSTMAEVKVRKLGRPKKAK